MIYVPGYWMNETSGALRPAIEAYLNGEPMTGERCAAMRAYIRQWMKADFHHDPSLRLIERIDELTTREAIDAWLNDAATQEIDPL